MAGWILRWISAVRTRLRQRLDLLLEFIALHHQLAVLQRTGTRRPCFRPNERLFWVFLSRWWTNWQRGLIIVQPATVLRWRRRGFWAIWGSGSCGRWRGGRPRISREVRALIVRMSRGNFLWGAPRIHGELLKLGFVVSQATVSRYMPRRGYPPTQRWRTFLRNQAFAIGAIGVGEAGRLSDVVRGWIMRVGRCATKVRNGHPGQAYRVIAPIAPISLFQSCRSALRPKSLRARLLRGPPLKAAPIGLGQSTTFAVSLKGITETQAARHLRIAHDHPLSRTEPSGPQFLYDDCPVRLPRTIRNTPKACSKK